VYTRDTGRGNSSEGGGGGGHDVRRGPEHGGEGALRAHRVAPARPQARSPTASTPRQRDACPPSAVTRRQSCKSGGREPLCLQNLRLTLAASEIVCTERTPRSTTSSSSARSPSCGGRRRDALSNRDARNPHSLREATRFVGDGATDESTQNCERNAKTETTVSPDAPRTRAARACRSAASSAHTAPGARRAGAARDVSN
jgi:hypothetical protein